MALPYRCMCFAIPPKLLKSMAEKSGEETGGVLRAGADSASKLRTQRAAIAKQKKELPPKAAPSEVASYKRHIFDVANGFDLPGKALRVEGQKAVPDKAANHAYDNVGVALDFYFEVFSRDSIDDRGARVESSVHYGENFGNALWTGERMVFGDGDALISDLTQSIDLIAHELTHGVVQHLVPGGLGAVRIPVRDRKVEGQTHELRGQSGSLNESFADVMASLVKQWHLGQTVRKADWLIGADVLADEMGKAVRSLKDPGNRELTYPEDDQMKSMDQYEEGADVHDGSGIPSHAFYLAAEAIGGFAWEKTGLIWYDAFAVLKPRSTFSDAAKATLRMAKKRFGDKSKEFKAVEGAWRQVGVIRREGN
jgi:Zn-dependent metalloprotease